ncbi:hypothetical protein TeGR_g14098 [Tetraparma gracilis]|uniref:Uncharacterized protein n=1 Tax=Tetraparma gracilis TaxID=2962635 RepID=A0ABQ6MSC0_9STRA|nr:hypothetical protein TeGR_g14098 [Tetraparma gracilis]
MSASLPPLLPILLLLLLPSLSPFPLSSLPLAPAFPRAAPLSLRQSLVPLCSTPPSTPPSPAPSPLDPPYSSPPYNPRNSLPDNSTIGLSHRSPSSPSIALLDIREQVRDDRISFKGPATGQVLLEHVRPKPVVNVLLLLRRGDPELSGEVAGDFLPKILGGKFPSALDASSLSAVHVYLEPAPFAALEPALPSLRPFLPGSPPMHLCVTLGGDGLVMHASALFPGAAPPVLAVAAGSLGFLTPFDRADLLPATLWACGLTPPPAGPPAAPDLPDLNEPPALPPIPRAPAANLSLRMRLTCTIVGADGLPRASLPVLNELAVDRGASSYLAELSCHCDGVFLTTIAADGVLVATPTGSTAYSLAAGGSVVHPAVPAILLTPICPHVLSFRSMLLPDHVTLTLALPEEARADAQVAFDGKSRQPLRRGEKIEISMSPFPMPTINGADHSTDWLGGLRKSFHFNERVRQKPLGENYWR